MRLPSGLRRRFAAAVLPVFLIAPLLPAGVVLNASAAQAQTGADQQPDYAAWETVARRAEDQVAAREDTDAEMNATRAEIVGWRDRFSQAQGVNTTRLNTLRGQIDALGPAPAEGASEAPDIAARRSELNDELARLEAPRIAAVEAYSRADGIIREIDLLLRERQAAALLKTSPAPINPANWPAAFTGIQQSITRYGQLTAKAWSSPSRMERLRANLPVALLLVTIGGLILWRGGRLMDRLLSRFGKGASDRGRFASELTGVTVGLILPVVGTELLSEGLDVTGLLAFDGRTSLAVLPLYTLPIFFARWLARWLFPQTGEVRLSLPPGRQSEGRLHMAVLGVLMSLELIRELLLDTAVDETRSLVSFVLVLLAALSMARLGQMLRQHARSGGADDEERNFRNQMIGLLGTAVLAVSVLAPVLSAVGYVDLGSTLVWASVKSLALTATLVLVQRLFRDLYGIITGSSEGARDALLPILIGFLLTLLALPVFALIWGARMTDLAEAWTQIRNGINIGGIRISPTVFLTLIVVFAALYTITRLVQATLRTAILPKTRLDKGGQNAIIAGTGYVGVSLAALFAVLAAGIDLSSIAIVAGALSLGIGFGLQNIVQNFVSGIILLIERPVSEGDWIEVGTRQGIVKSISVRSTRIETFDRTDVIVPNADLVSGQVTNWTHGDLTGRVIVPVGVAYGSDTRRVEEVLLEIARNHPLVMLTPEPRAFFMSFGPDSLNFEIRALIRDVNFGLSVRSDMNHEIVRRFAEEGFTIPIPQRDLWLRNPEALGDALAPRVAGQLDPAGLPPPAYSAAPTVLDEPATGVNNDPAEDDA